LSSLPLSSSGEILETPLPVLVSRSAVLTPWVYVLAAAAVLVHLLFNRQYGYFRDELYYAACGQYPAWGYVDHAPLVAWVAHGVRAALGDSLSALRFLPAVSAAAKVWLAGWMACEMGGEGFAQILAAVATLVAPIYLTFDNFLSMNAFEPVFWMACAAIVLRILNGGDRRLWVWFGVVAGVGLLNKHSMLFFGSGIVVGMLLTPARREFASKWFFIGAAIAGAIFLPNVLWEWREGWPTIALLRHVVGGKYATVAPWDYIWQQTLLTLPVSAPLWIGGLWFLLRDPRGKRYAVLGWAYMVVLVEMLALQGKIYYLAPAYIMLLAAGAVWWESLAWVGRMRWVKPAMIAALVVAGAIAAPLAMPVLPVEQLIRYARFWDVKAIRVENVPQDDLPQLFGDMFGWQEQVAAVAGVYGGLSKDEKEQTAILAYNYGEAGAVDYFGGRYGLPKAVSGHNQYGFWGPRRESAKVVIAIGFTEEFLRQFFGEVTVGARLSPEYALPEERDLTVFVCRDPKISLAEAWPRMKYLN
jgi:4-amino-4-deoxy-L-arabinose transferase-like glycosyltransferase